MMAVCLVNELKIPDVAQSFLKITQKISDKNIAVDDANDLVIVCKKKKLRKTLVFFKEMYFNYYL